MCSVHEKSDKVSGSSSDCQMKAIDMPLRDYIAIHASEEDIRNNMKSFDESATIQRTREQARYFYADMMLKARGK